MDSLFYFPLEYFPTPEIMSEERGRLIIARRFERERNEKLEKERNEKLERERNEKLERKRNEKLEKEKLERERNEKLEKEKLEKEKNEKLSKETRILNEKEKQEEEEMKQIFLKYPKISGIFSNQSFKNGIFFRSDKAHMWRIIKFENGKYVLVKTIVSKLDYVRYLINNQNNLFLFKTELCITTNCNNSQCRYAHSLEELRPIYKHVNYKTIKCGKFHHQGSCPYNNRCDYSHNINLNNYIIADLSETEMRNLIRQLF